MRDVMDKKKFQSKNAEIKYSTIQNWYPGDEEGFATEDVLNKFLNNILKSKPGEKFLMYRRDHDEGLVEGEGSTWLALSQQQESKIAKCLRDDDEIDYEIQFYEPTIQGLDECIGEIYGNQDELDQNNIDDLKKFKNEIISLSK